MGTSLSGDLALKYPITGIARCCACVVRGHTAAPTVPASPMMNARLLITTPEAQKGHRIDLPFSHEGVDDRYDVRFGSKAEMCASTDYVRFRPKADMCDATRDVCFGPKADIANLIALFHSIKWSARPISVLGTLRPSALAVLRLITSSYLVGACTGRSPGLSPLRMRST